MTTSLATPPRLSSPRPSTAAVARAVLAAGAGLSAAAFVIAIVGLVVDQTVITGAPAWMKPAKFAFSIAVFLLTLRWILSYVRGHDRLLAVLGTVITVALVAEIALVEMQVLRGTTSHYNEATDFDAAVFYAMGGIVSLVVIATIAAGVLALRQRGLDPGLATGLRWGIGISVLGMLSALAMIFNTGWNDSGGHTVGAADGGAGMPITGWSLEHGDLRIGHFVGLHALQLLPLLAWALLRWTRLDATTRARLLAVAGATYTAVVLLVIWQAMRGQSVVRPDGATLAVAAGLTGLAAVAVVAVLRRSRGRTPSRRS
ncbi:hypothetical protein J2X63_002086 [Agromyces sp. 3263]|uniref:hypothetical protein n=1 Tax=Agromyces sp. 3263 TaxID=2817750 RepID=UPI0028627257|nr:hypothetical protein [Agromyces sp. 3263]MDR6906400.1 hypothetical protein [Agromyces sp. 3263]